MSQEMLYFLLGFTIGIGITIAIGGVVKFMIDTITDRIKEVTNK